MGLVEGGSEVGRGGGSEVEMGGGCLSFEPGPMSISVYSSPSSESPAEGVCVCVCMRILCSLTYV